MRWIRTIAVGLAAALTASALSVNLATADDCNQPAPDDFRSDVAWDGTGLHHQPQDVQDLFSSVWGTHDDLHVRTWAWQHNCRPQPRDQAADPTDVTSTTSNQEADAVSSSQSGGGGERRVESGLNISYAASRSRCHGTPWPPADQAELFAAGTWYFCNESTGEWVLRKRARPGIDYAVDRQLVSPDVGRCAAGFTHYDPLSQSCLQYPDGPDV